MQFDGQGRIQIPENLMKYSGICKEVSVIGMINKIELWDPSTISITDSKADELDDNNFDDLANEINF